MSGYLKDVAVLARKDLTLELRARDTLPAMALFVVSTLVVFHFALPDGGGGDTAAYGLLWVALVFTALLGLARVWLPERESGAMDGLLLATADRSAIWLAKTISAFVFLAAVEVVALPAFALFFSPLPATAVLGAFLASIGLCVVGSLASAMATAARGREVILPLLLLPLTLPLVVGGVGSAVSSDPGRYLVFIAVYDVIFSVLSWAVFEYVVTE